MNTEPLISSTHSFTRVSSAFSCSPFSVSVGFVEGVPLASCSAQNLVYQPALESLPTNTINHNNIQMSSLSSAFYRQNIYSTTLQYLDTFHHGLMESLINFFILQRQHVQQTNTKYIFDCIVKKKHPAFTEMLNKHPIIDLKRLIQIMMCSSMIFTKDLKTSAAQVESFEIFFVLTMFSCFY